MDQINMFTAAFLMEPSQEEGRVFAGERSPGVVSLCESSYPNIGRVRCYVREGVARLEGRVSTYHQKQLAQEMARRTPGVRRIQNQIRVEARE